jgi:hypothetical protein
MLLVHPFLFVLASRAATIRFRRAWIGPAVVGLALALTVSSSLRVAPHQLAYFNELVGGPAEGHRYLGDSNVDWGQGLKDLKAFMDREGLPMVYLSYFGSVPPAAYGIRYQYLPGMGPAMRIRWDVVPDGFARELVAVSVSNLQGLTLPGDPYRYRWLYRRKPVAKVGYSIFVYDVTDDADAHLQLARIYAAAGIPQGTAAELRKVLRLDPANPEAASLLSTLSAAAPVGRPPP